MKILLVSDTHESTRELEAILARHASEVKIACHMGDHARDLLCFQGDYPQLQMLAVAGNCDYSPDLRREIMLSLSPCLDSGAPAKNILLTHGHNIGVKHNLDRLAYYAKEKNAHAAFFGHTHCPARAEIGGVFLMNPGSPAFPRGGSKASYAIVEISEDGEISGKILPY